MSWRIADLFRRKPAVEEPKKQQEETIEAPKATPSMDELQTLDFLRERGVRQLVDWRPGQPFLYVLPEVHRNFRMPDFSMRPVDEVASVALISNPMILMFAQKPAPSGHILGYIEKDGIKVDYYAIDPNSKVSKLVGTSRPQIGSNPFIVRKANLFEVPEDSDLFKK